MDSIDVYASRKMTTYNEYSFLGTTTEGGTKIVYKILVIIWIFTGLAWVGALIGECTETAKAFTEKKEKKQV